MTNAIARYRVTLLDRDPAETGLPHQTRHLPGGRADPSKSVRERGNHPEMGE